MTLQISVLNRQIVTAISVAQASNVHCLSDPIYQRTQPPLRKAKRNEGSFGTLILAQHLPK